MGIVKRGANGGVNINIYSLRAIVDGSNVDQQNPELGDTLTVPAGKSYSLRMEVENAGGTGFLSDDNCNEGNGTRLSAYFSVPDIPEEGNLKQFVDGPNCHPDKGFLGRAATQFYEVGEFPPLSEGESKRVSFHVKGSNTFDRMTPIYYLDVTGVASDGGGGGNDDGTDDSGGDGGGDSQFEEYRVDVTDCYDLPSEINAGEEFRIDYRVENNNDQAATVTVDIIADGGANFGQVVLEQATFDLPANYWQERYSTPPAPNYEGDIDISVEVSNATPQ